MGFIEWDCGRKKETSRVGCLGWFSGKIYNVDRTYHVLVCWILGLESLVDNLLSLSPNLSSFFFVNHKKAFLFLFFRN